MSDETTTLEGACPQDWNVRAYELLRDIEWGGRDDDCDGGYVDCCPYCSGHQPGKGAIEDQGHNGGCQIYALLTAAKQVDDHALPLSQRSRLCELVGLQTGAGFEAAFQAVKARIEQGNAAKRDLALIGGAFDRHGWMRASADGMVVALDGIFDRLKLIFAAAGTTGLRPALNRIREAVATESRVKTLAGQATIDDSLTYLSGMLAMALDYQKVRDAVCAFSGLDRIGATGAQVCAEIDTLYQRALRAESTAAAAANERADAAMIEAQGIRRELTDLRIAHTRALQANRLLLDRIGEMASDHAEEVVNAKLSTRSDEAAALMAATWTSDIDHACLAAVAALKASDTPPVEGDFDYDPDCDRNDRVQSGHEATDA